MSLAWSHLHCQQDSMVLRYAALKNEMEQKRQELKCYYEEADSIQKDSLLKAAGFFLQEKLANELLPSWYGTPWDFNGKSRVPGKGSIACGYFIVNTLIDCAFKIPRNAWAQSASEPVIRKLCLKVKRMYDAPMDKVEKYIRDSGDGVYAAGLDFHVGYIVKKGNSIVFVHSNYMQAETGVMEEDIYTDNPFRNSRYRVIGKLFGYEMVRKWVMGETWD